VILKGLISALSRASTFDDALAHAARAADFSLTEGLRAPLLAGLLDARGRLGAPQVMLVVTATGRESDTLRKTLASMAPDAEIVEFPAWETLPHERLSPSAEIVGKRIDALRRLTKNDGSRPLIVVASVRAALQPLAENLAELEPVQLVAGKRGYDLAAL
jgi:transcription-repair coupling factor (superfamily II helicase)